VSTFRVIEGDCLSVLATLEPGRVQTCITSPPYFGLRDYGTATWDGGDSECEHRVSSGGPSMLQGASQRGRSDVAAGDCPHCGATRIDSQIGLEETPEQYVSNLVAVFREVRRVLRDDGTLWLNLGDSYYSTTATQGRNEDKSVGSLTGGTAKLIAGGNSTYRRDVPGLKPKDLIGIPWQVAFALRADGWYLRSDIIWAKPNPMPESVTDRPTKAHEYLFLLSKSARYYYDADAVREAPSESTSERWGDDLSKRRPDGEPTTAFVPGENTCGVHPNGRNKRSVWTVATQPFPGAHFATFPPKLIEPCVLAGAPVDGTVLDPFSGAGTTGVVALRHDRDYIGIELNPTYAQMARDRIYDDGPLLNEEAA
jgi:DNA modification methylase